MQITEAFAILGLPPSSTKSEITKRYRTLALSHHPDRQPSTSSTAASSSFAAISNAYEALTKLSSSVPVHDSTTGHDSTSLSTKVEVTGGFIGVARCLTVHEPSTPSSSPSLLLVSTDSCTFSFPLTPTSVLPPTVLSPSPSLCSSSHGGTFLIASENRVLEFDSSMNQLNEYETGEEKVTSLQHVDTSSTTSSNSIQYTTDDKLYSISPSSATSPLLLPTTITNIIPVTALKPPNKLPNLEIVKFEFIKQNYVSVTTSDCKGIVFKFDPTAITSSKTDDGTSDGTSDVTLSDDEDWFPAVSDLPPTTTPNPTPSTLTLPPSILTLESPIYDLSTNSTTLITVSSTKCHSYTINKNAYTLTSTLEPDSPPALLYSCILTQNYIILSGASGKVHVFNSSTFTPFKSFSCVEKSTCFLNTDTINCLAEEQNSGRIFVGGYQGVRVWKDDDMGSTITASDPNSLTITHIPFDVVRTHVFSFLNVYDFLLFHNLNKHFLAACKADDVVGKHMLASGLTDRYNARPIINEMYEESLIWVQNYYEQLRYVLNKFFFTPRDPTEPLIIDQKLIDVIKENKGLTMSLFAMAFARLDFRTSGSDRLMLWLYSGLSQMFYNDPIATLSSRVINIRMGMDVRGDLSHGIAIAGHMLCSLISQEKHLIPYKMKDGKFTGIDLIEANFHLTKLVYTQFMDGTQQYEDTDRRLNEIVDVFVEKLRVEDFEGYTFETHKELILKAAREAFIEPRANDANCVEGFRGNRSSYYSDENSYLPVVLYTKEGNPISLSVLYVEVVSRGLKIFFKEKKKQLNIVVRGLNFPSHFMVSMYEVKTSPPGVGLVLSAVYVDAFENYDTYTKTDIQGIAANINGGQAQGLSSHEVNTILDNNTPKNKITSTGISARNNNIQIFDRVLNNLRASKDRIPPGKSTTRIFHMYQRAILAYIQLDNQKHMPCNSDESKYRRNYMIKICFANLNDACNGLQVSEAVMNILKKKGWSMLSGGYG